jgi:GDP-L-fucose synthase
MAVVRDTSHSQFLRHVTRRVEIRQGDLLDAAQATRAIAGAQIAINCAARVGGIEYNIKHPGSIFRENMQVFLNVIEACRLQEVERFVIVSSACVYPRFCTVPTPEEEGFKDSPEPTNDGYGWSKRMEEYVGQAYAREFGMRVAIARPYNAYGPRDNFDPSSSHVLPALIRRVLSGEDPLNVWGSGNQTRAFLYAEDFAEGVLQVAEKYPVADAVNLGNDREISVREMVETILRITGRNPQVRYDTTKPEGQPRRSCDTRKMKEKLHWKPPTQFEEGLRKTVDWYQKQAGLIPAEEGH